MKSDLDIAQVMLDESLNMALILGEKSIIQFIDSSLKYWITYKCLFGFEKGF